MSRVVGTVSRGLRAPIVKKGDDLAQIVVDTVIHAAKEAPFTIHDKDIVAITESIYARAQGNYASLDAVAKDIHQKFQSESIGVVFPINSRNRFYNILQALARATKKVVIQLSYPADEVGNELISDEALVKSGVNPWTDTLSETEFRSHFEEIKHKFTGVDYVALYRECVEKEGAECEIIFSNQPQAILDYTDSVLVSDIHTRFKTAQAVKEAGAKTVYRLDEILTQSVDGSGYNEEYGLLGTNLSGDNELKLFPRDSKSFVYDVQKRLLEATGKKIEVMVYGDGAFKDPVGHIWELADPVVSPGYTSGLEGTPNEVKLKYLADNEFSDLSGQALEDAITDYISQHDDVDRDGKNVSLGTTPRQITDLVGSLSDLTSGSGDKGTPIVYIQGYFDNLSDEA
ncbi:MULTISPECIES: coenzyme F420-0:L-glutamate ligase [Aerococcus]|uniref:coenzyme F420-0:L-glutamate ligase n=1 Tax=Aerococcus TaxID=1375 RepID=UPI0018A74280|nr:MULTISPECIES: coenzyme F420-0:L-glutamate ligase [Aerococcus]MCY3035460.1 coenzyme F420-0:L-glutamate ligase [Aerococcus sp. Group 2]MCY3038882.1 coenzyme F420-0:L-glutamate ligase [Aerococcus sp. Group 2]MCY3041037.1 coenzyme F420-0:L-glutamate ligase [Aerococcus sp. Group 2]MCY3042275.1 coenzyme F420-0:L-glutamate ligase [Aerococcus sp. Group 2]MDK6520404.1 coenzyme F420-0:L-glutamate ligase [Aerococcus urinae]